MDRSPCYHHAYDPETGVFDLLLGDATPAVVGDEIRGATPEQATLALTQLGAVHGPLLGDPALAGAEWLNRESPLNQGLMAALYAGFVERYSDQISPSTATCASVWSPRFDAYLAAGGGVRTTAGPGARRLPPGQHAVR